MALPVARQSASSATRSSISAEVSGWKSSGRPSCSAKFGMPRSGRPVMMMRRSAWSLISARKAGTLIALTMSPSSSTPAPFGPWQPAQARAKTGGAAFAVAGRGLRAGRLGECIAGGDCGRVGARDFQFDLMPSARILICASVSGPPLGRGEWRHRGARAAVADDGVQVGVGDDGDEERIVERRCGAELAGRAVAAGAVGGEELVEVGDLVGEQRAVGGVGFARGLATDGNDEQQQCDRELQAADGGCWGLSARMVLVVVADDAMDC